VQMNMTSTFWAGMARGWRHGWTRTNVRILVDEKERSGRVD
jgi:hypothetical protein